MTMAAVPWPFAEIPRLSNAAGGPASVVSAAEAGGTLLTRPARGSAVYFAAATLAPHRARLTGVHAAVAASLRLAKLA